MYIYLIASRLTGQRGLVSPQQAPQAKFCDKQVL